MYTFIVLFKYYRHGTFFSLRRKQLNCQFMVIIRPNLDEQPLMKVVDLGYSQSLDSSQLSIGLL